jgi:uncharacterized protein
MTEPENRLDYSGARRLLERRLAEPAPGRIQLLTGPRQVGKTTLLLELQRRRGRAALYAAVDAPEAALPAFWERLFARAEEEARSRKRAYLLLDEVQSQPSWAARLKSEWDRIRRLRLPLHVVATGSSALRLRSGSRESLAGRFERLTLAHWPAASLKSLLRVSGPAAAEASVRLGGYPGALALRAEPERFRAYVRESIVEPAIGRDILALEVVRRPGLLRQVFAMCVAAPTQVLSLQKLQGQLADRGALETIAHYLQLLEEAYLVTGVGKFSERLLRRRAAPPKIVVLNNALLVAGDPRGAPGPTEPARFGAWVENACLAHAWNQSQALTYWREEPLEVDGVTEGSWGAWAIEVKTGAYGAADLRGLLEFCRRYPRFRPLVLRGPEGASAARRAGVESMPWAKFLLAGPPRGRSRLDS